MANQVDSGTISEVSPSVAGDIGSVDQLEEDEAWGKVGFSKRKAVFRREHDALAHRVRYSLGKVSSAASPFKR